MTTYDFVFNALGLRDWCDAAKIEKNPMSMAELLAKNTGHDKLETQWWEVPFPSMDTLNKTCANFPQSRDLTAAVEQSFLAVKDLLRLVLDPLTQPLSWLLESTLIMFDVTPWWIVITVLMAIVYYASKSLKLVSLVLICISFLAAIDHYNHAIQNTCYYFRLCIFMCSVWYSNWYCYVP